jgi:hypothetical protein
MLGEYARQHVLLCLVPAMFIAGAITVFLNLMIERVYGVSVQKKAVQKNYSRS